MHIDVDHHFEIPEVFTSAPAEFKDTPKIVERGAAKGLMCVHGHARYPPQLSPMADMKHRIGEMDEAGFDRACLIRLLYRSCISAQTEAYLAQAYNDKMADFVKENERLIPVGDISHKDPKAAAAEAERAVKKLGFRAIGIEGDWNEKNIESPDWWPFFDAIQRLDVPMLCHPRRYHAHVGVMDPHTAAHERIDKFPAYLAELFGFLTTEMVAIAGLIYSGLLDRFPKLKFVWLETDVGWVPGLMAMLDGMYEAYTMVLRAGEWAPLSSSMTQEPIRLKKKPSQYFRDNFCFTVIYDTDLQLRTLLPVIVNQVGLGRNIVVETDFPHAEGSVDIVHRIQKLEGIDQESKERILGGNMEELLKIKPIPSQYARLYR